MKNITLKIDDETYRRARVLAAEAGTSVSAMVREYLERRAGEEDAYAERMASLRELYRIAGERGGERCAELEPLGRDEVYGERVR